MEEEGHRRDNENETSGEEHEEEDMSQYVAMEVELIDEEDNQLQVKGEPLAHICTPECQATESLHESIMALHEDVINLRKEIKMQRKTKKRKHESDTNTKTKASKQPKEMDSLAAHLQVCAVEDRKPDMLQRQFKLQHFTKKTTKCHAGDEDYPEIVKEACQGNEQED